jgi:hypothetical protein
MKKSSSMPKYIPGPETKPPKNQSYDFTPKKVGKGTVTTLPGQYTGVPKAGGK